MKYFSMEFSYVIPGFWKNGKAKPKQGRGEMMVVLSGSGELTEVDMEIAEELVSDKLVAIGISNYRMICGDLVPRKVFANYLVKMAEKRIPFRRL